MLDKELCGTRYAAQAQFVIKFGESETGSIKEIGTYECLFIDGGRNDELAVKKLYEAVSNDIGLSPATVAIKAAGMVGSTSLRLIIHVYSMPDGLFADGFVVDRTFEDESFENVVLMSHLDWDA